MIQPDEKSRLGSKFGAQEVKEHVFFRAVDWAKVDRLELTPPFKPKVKSAQDVANFDKTFVDQTPVDSFVHSKIA